MSRPETGPMQFGDDWPGVFIRGDNAFHYAMCLRDVLNNVSVPTGMNAISAAVVEGLIELLHSCDVRQKPESAVLKAYDDCAVIK